MRSLLDQSVERGIISRESRPQVDAWMRARNEVVHSSMPVARNRESPIAWMMHVGNRGLCGRLGVCFPLSVVILMGLYVAVTDKGWFALHASKAEVEEVNF